MTLAIGIIGAIAILLMLFLAGWMLGQAGKGSGGGRNGKSWRGAEQQPADSNFWGDVEWLECIDGKTRPTKSGLFPLAPGLPGRVGTLRGAGNAITPQVAARFIRAYQDYCR